MSIVDIEECVQCGTTEYASTVNGVCDRCRGRARTRRWRNHTSYDTVDINAECVECEWQNDGYSDLQVGSQARRHAKETGHAVSVRRVQERFVPGDI